MSTLPGTRARSAIPCVSVTPLRAYSAVPSALPSIEVWARTTAPLTACPVTLSPRMSKRKTFASLDVGRRRSPRSVLPDSVMGCEVKRGNADLSSVGDSSTVMDGSPS